MKPDKRFPTVSVIISTYDRPKMLDRALESVWAQTYDDFEVWVVDDHTQDFDAMTAVLSKWSTRFEERNVPFYAARTGENSGYQCVPKNIGILQCSGDFIAYLDDDNTWMPEHLSVLMDSIWMTEADMVYGGRRYINDTDNKELISGDCVAEPWDPERLNHENYIDTSDILHARGILYMLAATDGYMWNENLMRFADWNLVQRIGKGGFLAVPVPAILSSYYWHGNNLQLTRPITGDAPVTVTLGKYREMVADESN